MINRKDKTIQFSEYAGHFSDHINNAEKLRTESLQRLQTPSKRMTLEFSFFNCLAQAIPSPAEMEVPLCPVEKAS